MVTMQCQPTAEGSRIAQLQIATNDPAQPLVSYDLECSGTPITDTQLPPTMITLEVELAGNGTGRVTSQPEGIDCGTDCTADYPSDSTVTLAATPLDQSIFTGWIDGCQGDDPLVTVTMGQAKTCLAVFEITTQVTCPNTNVIYVDKLAQGDKSGQSWNDGMTDLQAALTLAATCDIEQIWVANGTYYPTTTLDRSATFHLLNGVAIYGGFAGTETYLSERDTTAYPTILSGDIGIVGYSHDNSYHVVTGSGTDATAILDGFIITQGAANDGETCPNACGGGFYNDNGSPTLSSLLFRKNSAIYGGGLFNGHHSHPTVQKSFFESNSATYGGGMMNLDNSSPILCQVFFTDNSAKHSGGGIINQDQSHPKLRQLQFTGNWATYSGGGMLNDNSSPVLTHSLLYNNTASEGGGIVNLNNSQPLFSNLILTGNLATQAGGAILNQNSSPLISQTTVASNLAAQGGGLVNIGNSMAQINNSIWWDNTDGNDTVSLAQITDQDNSVTTVTYSIVQGGWNGSGSHNKDENPLFVGVSNNVIAARFQLQLGSPAIDAGHNADIPSELADCHGGDTAVAAVAFDGQPRLADGDGNGLATVDMGAYEAPTSSLPHHRLTITRTGTGSGTVTSTTTEINCGSICSQDYPDETEVTLIAHADEGSVFRGWLGACQGAGSVTVFMIDPMTCEAQFDRLPEAEIPIPPPTPEVPIDIPPQDDEEIDSCLITSSVIQGVVCNLDGKRLKDVHIMDESSLSNLVLEGTIENEGWVANATLLANSSLTGGILTGEITNYGTLVDFEFLGSLVTGGTLSGTIINNSGGTFQDVNLGADTYISGGKLTGQIMGDSAAPAALENIIVTAGSYLDNVIIGDNVTLADDVTYGPGVEFVNQPYVTPSLVIHGTQEADGQTFKDVTIAADGVLINAVLEGTIMNFGVVSEVTLSADSHLIGGLLKGEIINHGTLQDIKFRGTQLSGGTLAGFINNGSDAIIQDVDLAANAYIRGGYLQGCISGDSEHPALLESLTVLPGSCLEYVIIGKEVNLPEGVALKNVTIDANGKVSKAVLEGLIYNQGRILNATIQPGSDLAGGILAGEMTNHGTVIDVTFLGKHLTGGTLAGSIKNGKQSVIQEVGLAANTRLSGGYLQGRIEGDAGVTARLDSVTLQAGCFVSSVIIGDNVINEGCTIADFEFQGSVLSGGTLSGAVINSKGGLIKNVHLAPGTQVSGGNLLGDIIGDADAPALLENMIVVADSLLENVIIGDNVTLPDGVQLGAGVQFANGSVALEQVVSQPEMAATGLIIDPGGQLELEYEARFIGEIRTSDDRLQSNQVLLSYSQVDSLKLSVKITVAGRHVGEKAELLMVAMHRDFNRAADSKRVWNNWQLWDDQISSLKPVKTYQKLPAASFEVEVYQGRLTDIAAQQAWDSEGSA